MPKLIRRVLETGHERLLSADDVSQTTLDHLQPLLAEALESRVPVSIGGGYWLRAKVEFGLLHARVWYGNDPQGAALIAMTVNRTSREGMPVLEVSLAGTRANVVGHGVDLELEEFVERVAWCWLLRCLN